MSMRPLSLSALFPLPDAIFFIVRSGIWSSEFEVKLAPAKDHELVIRPRISRHKTRIDSPRAY
jgi:hypothetical protein